MNKLAHSVSSVLPAWARNIIRKGAISAMPFINLDIERIGNLFETDKGLHGYLPHYEAHFARLRRKILNILKIGIGGYKDPKSGGASLRLWQNYFKKSQIYGLEFYEKSFHNDKRIKTFLGSQNDPAFLERMVSKIGKIDIIIDDGSHVSEHIINSFNTLFPHLTPGGFYLIEDINTFIFQLLEVRIPTL